MRYKLINKEDGQEVILIGEVKNENPIITKINKILVKQSEPKLVGFPYKDCRAVRKEFERRSEYKHYVFVRHFPLSKSFVKRVIKVKVEDEKSQAKFENEFSRCRDFLDGLTADLNTYFRLINSFSMSTNLLPQKRSLEELKCDLCWVKKSFFERWRQYIPLKKFISIGKTPSLYKNLKLHNEQRILLTKLIFEIIELKNEKL